MEQGLTVFVIYAHAYMRQAMRRILDAQPGIRVVGEGSSAILALREIREKIPDVVLCDAQVEGYSGIELTARVTKVQPQTKILVVSSVLDGTMPGRVMDAGARGYLHSGCTVEELVTAMQKIVRGELYLSRTVAQSLALQRRTEVTAMSRLSPRELEVGLLLTQGYRPQQIAKNLSLSVKTVSTHKARLFTKLEVTNVPKLVTVFRDHGYDVLPI